MGWFRSRISTAAVVWLAGAGGVAEAATFSVNVTGDASDASPGNGVCQTASGDCSLRAAVEEANAWAGMDLIIVPPGTYALTAASPSTLVIDDDVRIRGSRFQPSVVDGQSGGGVLDIRGRAADGRRRIRVELHHLTIQAGLTGSGGGVNNSGALVLIHRCIVRQNRADSAGAGIRNAAGGAMWIVRSTVDDNGDPLGGGDNPIGLPGRSGGIENGADAFLYLNQSTLSNNRANRFGGMRNLGVLIATNSTLSGNLADVDTAGLINTGIAYLNNVTITDNHTLSYDPDLETIAGGVFNTEILLFANTIIAGNSYSTPFEDNQDCGGTLTSFGYNLIGDTAGCDIAGSGSGLILDTDPLLGPLAFNGGPTRTHAIAADSPARNAGNPAFPTGFGLACEPIDQRFRARGVGPGVSRCDIGAYERAGAPGQEGSP